jgi:RNA polymerase sigma factor (sigma-70 family)
MESSLLEHLYDEHARSVYSTAYRLLRDPDAAADITQEAFLRALTAEDQLANPRAWLLTVATNSSLSYLRGRKRVASIDGELDRDDDAQSSEPPAAAEADPGYAAGAADQVALVLRLVDELRPDQRAALLARYVDDVPIEDIASALGKSANATTVLLHRARRAMRERYAAHVFARRGLPATCRTWDGAIIAMSEDERVSDDARAHVAVCHYCTESLAELRGMTRTMSLFPPIALPAALKVSLLTEAARQGLVSNAAQVLSEICKESPSSASPLQQPVTTHQLPGLQAPHGLAGSHTMTGVAAKSVLIKLAAAGLIAVLAGGAILAVTRGSSNGSTVSAATPSAGSTNSHGLGAAPTSTGSSSPTLPPTPTPTPTPTPQPTLALGNLEIVKDLSQQKTNVLGDPSLTRVYSPISLKNNDQTRAALVRINLFWTLSSGAELGFSPNLQAPDAYGGRIGNAAEVLVFPGEERHIDLEVSDDAEFTSISAVVDYLRWVEPANGSQGPVPAANWLGRGNSNTACTAAGCTWNNHGPYPVSVVGTAWIFDRSGKYPMYEFAWSPADAVVIPAGGSAFVPFDSRYVPTGSSYYPNIELTLAQPAFPASPIPTPTPEIIATPGPTDTPA